MSRVSVAGLRLWEIEILEQNERTWSMWMRSHDVVPSLRGECTWLANGFRSHPERWGEQVPRGALRGCAAGGSLLWQA